MNTILFLSSLADRSFNDIMQYPVMPWIIADYTSPSLGEHQTVTDTLTLYIYSPGLHLKDFGSRGGGGILGIWNNYLGGGLRLISANS